MIHFSFQLKSHFAVDAVSHRSKTKCLSELGDIRKYVLHKIFLSFTQISEYSYEVVPDLQTLEPMKETYSTTSSPRDNRLKEPLAVNTVSVTWFDYFPE